MKKEYRYERGTSMDRTEVKLEEEKREWVKMRRNFR